MDAPGHQTSFATMLQVCVNKIKYDCSKPCEELAETKHLNLKKKKNLEKSTDIYPTSMDLYELTVGLQIPVKMSFSVM